MWFCNEHPQSLFSWTVKCPLQSKWKLVDRVVRLFETSSTEFQCWGICGPAGLLNFQGEFCLFYMLENLDQEMTSDTAVHWTTLAMMRSHDEGWNDSWRLAHIPLELDSRHLPIRMSISQWPSESTLLLNSHGLNHPSAQPPNLPSLRSDNRGACCRILPAILGLILHHPWLPSLPPRSRSLLCPCRLPPRPSHPHRSQVWSLCPRNASVKVVHNPAGFGSRMLWSEWHRLNLPRLLLLGWVGTSRSGWTCQVPNWLGKYQKWWLRNLTSHHQPHHNNNHQQSASSLFSIFLRHSAALLHLFLVSLCHIWTFDYFNIWTFKHTSLNLIGEPVKWGAIISLHLLVLPQFDLYDPAPRPLVTLVLSGSTSMFLKSSGDLSFDHEVSLFLSSFTILKPKPTN